MKIELYYFKECPSYIETARNLQDALDKLGIKDNIQMIEVVNSEDSVNKKFLGSPTIRINGTDIENKNGNYVFACRIYSIDGKITGILPKEYILLRLKYFINL